MLVAALAAATGVLMIMRAAEPGVAIVAAALAITVGQAIAVPAPSGERLFLGIGAAAAALFLITDGPSVVAMLSFGVVGSWVVFTIRSDERMVSNSWFIAEMLAMAVFAVTVFGVRATVASFTLPADWEQLLSVAIGGVAWYASRAFLRSLVGLERVDLSVRYLWLLALEDWSVIVSIFVAGALFGFAWPVMGVWAFLVALMPYAFSHLAFVRYHGTRVTYGQTIRALGQIPEVAGLAPLGHATRTAGLAVAIARELGLHPEDVVELEYAALMHDVGRITLNEPAILRAGYTDEDIARWGSQIIAEAPHLSQVAEIVRVQHRPYRRAGQERDTQLPEASKIIKVASAFDQARNEMNLSPVDALEQIHRGSAYDFDPDVAASLRRVLVHRGLVAK